MSPKNKDPAAPGNLANVGRDNAAGIANGSDIKAPSIGSADDMTVALGNGQIVYRHWAEET